MVRHWTNFLCWLCNLLLLSTQSNFAEETMLLSKRRKDVCFSHSFCFLFIGQHFSDENYCKFSYLCPDFSEPSQWDSINKHPAISCLEQKQEKINAQPCKSSLSLYTVEFAVWSLYGHVNVMQNHAFSYMKWQVWNARKVQSFKPQNHGDHLSQGWDQTKWIPCLI